MIEKRSRRICGFPSPRTNNTSNHWSPHYKKADNDRG